MLTHRFIFLFSSVAALLLLATACSQEVDVQQRDTPRASVEPPTAESAPQVFDPSRSEPEPRLAQRADSGEIEVRAASKEDRDRYYEARERAKRR